jgi:hypothetical protein
VAGDTVIAGRAVDSTEDGVGEYDGSVLGTYRGTAGCE